MPLTAIQKRILDVIKQNRGPESYVAGGAALNRNWPRLSDDLDIFGDKASAIVEQAQADIKALRQNGFKVSISVMQFAIAEAEVQADGEQSLVQWMDETVNRFFPIIQDADFGWRLHDADLAVNKILAGASRTRVRDAVDLAKIHAEYLPLGYLAWAAAGKTPMTPVDILERVIKNAVSHPAEEFAEIRSTTPVNGRDVIMSLMQARDEGVQLAEALPATAYGCLFIGEGDQPGLAAAEEIAAGAAKPWKISKYGAWPNFPDQAPMPARRPNGG